MSAYGPAVLHEHLQHASYYFAPDGLAGEARVPIGPDHALSLTVVGILHDKSERLAEVPQDESGMRTDKVARFFAAQGLSVKPFIGVDAEGQQRINEIANIKGSDQTIASHFPLLGLTYIRYNADDTPERRQAKEPSVVHELTHASQPHLSILISEDERLYRGVGYTIAQNGFTVRASGQKTGEYFEEGLASLEAHAYIVDELGMPNGLLDREEPLHLRLESGDDYSLPGSYTWQGDNGRLTWSPSAHAAFGLQLLNEQNPEIVPAMLDTRRSNRGAHAFAGKVDDLLPGLYDELNIQPYDSAHFMQATNYIVDSLYGGDYDKALAASAAQDGLMQSRESAA